MATRSTIFSSRKQKDPFDDIAGQKAPDEKKGFITKMRSMFSKKNPSDKYKVTTLADNAGDAFILDRPDNLIDKSHRAAIEQAAIEQAAIEQAAIEQAAIEQAAIEQAITPKKTVSSSRSSSIPSNSRSSRSSSIPSNSRSSRSSSIPSNSRSSSNPSSSSTSSSAKFKQDLFQQGVIYHNGKRKITESQIKKWETESKNIHSIILDNFQFTDNNLYLDFLDFLGSCVNLKYLIIKRKDVKKDVKKEVDYFKDKFFLSIEKLITLELLELNSFHIKRLNEGNAKSDFFHYFVILLSKLQMLKILILKNNYMYETNNNFAVCMFIEREEGKEEVFEDSKSITYRYALKKGFRNYTIYIDFFKKVDFKKVDMDWETLGNRFIYLHAVDNKFIQDKKSEQYLEDFKTFKPNPDIIRGKLLNTYNITILDT